LTEPMLMYARYDVHYLVTLRKLLMRDLTRYELWDRSSAAKHEEAKQVASALAAIQRKFDEDEYDLDGGSGDDGATNESGYETPMDFVDTDDDGDDNFEDSRMEMVTDDGDHHPQANGEAKAEQETKQSKFDSRELRMQSDLMRVISRSQDRCEDLWSNKPESHAKNSDYLALRKRCQNGDLPAWTSSQSELYDKLARWRNFIASQEECLTGFACPTELLIFIAYKRPTTKLQLKRLSYKLPPLLDDPSKGYANEMYAMAQESLVADGMSRDADDEAIPVYRPKRQSTSRSAIFEGEDGNNKSTKRNDNEWMIGATLLAATITVATVVILSQGRRRR